MLLLIMAITIHNIPEGLAVGVAFGAVGSSPSATFEKARYMSSFLFFSSALKHALKHRGFR